MPRAKKSAKKTAKRAKSASASTSSARSIIDQLLRLSKIAPYSVKLKNFLKKNGFDSPLEQGIENPFLSIVFIVAGKQFKTAEEADEWLTYLCERTEGNEFLFPESINFLSSLHFACKWGNYFGVEWFAHRVGAGIINGTDRRGRLPYSYACESRVDTIKKMRLLEEKGSNILPSDICLAATNPFEDACEVFHYLVSTKKLSVNATDTEGNTPLHCACHKGSISGVKWLVEHGAAIESVNNCRQTPIMLACERSLDRLSKMDFLDEKGADFLAKDNEDRTALFYVRGKENVTDAIQHLVRKKKIDVHSSDKMGRTALLHECSSLLLSEVVIQQLIDMGSDVFAKDVMGRNALHLAAKNMCMRPQAINILIRENADVRCKDKNGKTPHELANDGEIRRLLRQRYDAVRFSNLLTETIRPDSIKFCVIGDEMVGKTTLVNSLLQLNCPPIDPQDRTPGIEIRHCLIPGVGKGSTWDFGFQPTFYGAHGLFFRPSNTMFALVLHTKEGEKKRSEEDLVQKGRFWCAFVKASLRTLSPHLISLFLILNLNGVEEEAGIEAGFQLKRVAAILQKEFEDTFKISHVIEMDCSKSDSVRMTDCREKLKQVRKEVLDAADGVPKLCSALEGHLCKSPPSFFVTPEEFSKWVAELKDVGFPLTENEQEVAIDYLDSSGIIVNLGQRICLQPPWLCQNIIGPLLAPSYFPYGMPSRKSDMVSKEDIKSALEAFGDYLQQKGTPSPYKVTVDEAIEVLCYLELCISVEKMPGMYQIPALLNDSIPDDAWQKESTLDVYRGQRYECVHSVDIISPSSFVVLQFRCSRMANVSHKAWKNGVKLVKIVEEKVVECLITMGIKKGRHCIGVILRWSRKDKCEAVAKEFLDELKLMIAAVCDEKSPGVTLKWFYIDSSHLERLNDDPAVYLSSDVDEKVADKALHHVLFSTRPEKENRCCIRDLVILVDGTKGSYTWIKSVVQKMRYLTEKLDVNEEFLNVLMEEELITLGEKRTALSLLTNNAKVSYIIEDVLRFKRDGDVDLFFGALEKIRRSYIVEKLKA